MNNNELFKSTKDAYTWLNNKSVLNLPDSFEALTFDQQEFFINFFENCKEVQCEDKSDEMEESTDQFLAAVRDELGFVGENTIENILYRTNMKVVADN